MEDTSGKYEAVSAKKHESVGLDAIRSAIERGAHVTMLMRHAERPPLDPTDTSFGAQLPITDVGRETAARLGGLIRDVLKPKRIDFYAGETLRTVQTAACMRTEILRVGTEMEVAEILHEPVLGGASPFFGSLEERMALIAEGRYLDRLNDYYRLGEQRGYRPLCPATREMEERLFALANGSGGLSVAVTHDVNVACFLVGGDVCTSFTSETWPHYLDAAVVIREKGGSIVTRGCLRWHSYGLPSASARIRVR